MNEIKLADKMKKINQLFFELLQVAVGQLDCLSRGPEPEEWLQLYEMSKQQNVEGIGYHGVMKLFEFGLRAPQDVSLDWMAESETIRENNEAAERPSIPALCYAEELQELRQRSDDEPMMLSDVVIERFYLQYLRRELTMRDIMDYYYVLMTNRGITEPLKGGRLMASLGVRRFGRGMMWILQEVLKLDSQYMPFKPLEKEGRLLLHDVMRDASKVERVLHVLLRYPLGIGDLRA